MIAERLIREALFEPHTADNPAAYHSGDGTLTPTPCGFVQVRSYVRRAKPEAYVKTHDRLREEVERGGEGVG